MGRKCGGHREDDLKVSASARKIIDLCESLSSPRVLAFPSSPLPVYKHLSSSEYLCLRNDILCPRGRLEKKGGFFRILPLARLFRSERACLRKMLPERRSGQGRLCVRRVTLTITLKTTDIVVMPMILAQYGKPITAFSATQGVNIVTAKFSRLRIT